MNVGHPARTGAAQREPAGALGGRTRPAAGPPVVSRPRPGQRPGQQARTASAAPHPRQVIRNRVRIPGPRGIAQVLDEVIPQVPVLVPSSHQATGTGHPAARSGGLAAGRPCATASSSTAAQAGQPLLPEFGAQEIADHIMPGNATGWSGSLRHQGELGQPLAHPHAVVTGLVIDLIAGPILGGYPNVGSHFLGAVA
jgi:hypothetical protein